MNLSQAHNPLGRRIDMCKTFVMLFAAAGMLTAADLPYAGTWKFNAAKSDFRESTVTFTQLGSGEMQFNMDGQSYTFKTDGKDYPALFGQTAAWTKVDANTWVTTDKLNGKTLTTDTTTLSPDGKTLTVNFKGPKPDGGTIDDTVVYQRVSGGPGLVGKWKTRSLKSSSPSVMQLAAAGDDGLTLKIVDMNIVCDAKFDGKDYPATGPTVAPGFTIAIKKAGPRGFEMTQKQNGKALYHSTRTASADGKTLTSTGSPVGVNEKFKVVYDRQ
jgi:hypothetical protein